MILCPRCRGIGVRSVRLDVEEINPDRKYAVTVDVTCTRCLGTGQLEEVT